MRGTPGSIMTISVCCLLFWNL